MSLFPRARTVPARHRTVGLAAAAIVGSTALLVSVGQPASASIVPTVPLASAANYSVLASTTVTNTNPSVIGQSVGLSPGTAITGFPPGIVLAPATIAAANSVTLQARSDLVIGYVDAANRPVEFTLTGPDLVGQTLAPGVYEAPAHGPLGLSGSLVLDGGGDPDAVFIFQTDSTLITSTGSTVALINGASECNVFWQVGSSATLGSGSLFVGNILALTSVTVESSVVVRGRALARNGAVTLDNNVFTQPDCTPSTDTVPTATAPSTTTTTTTAAPATTTAITTTPVATNTPTTVAPGVTPSPTNAAAPAGPFDDVDITLPRTGGVGASTTPVGSSDIRLPSTGSSSMTAFVIGLVALVLGAGAVAIARRRQPV